MSFVGDQRLDGVRWLVFFVHPLGQAVLELFLCLAERAGQLWKLGAAEQHENYEEDNN